MDARSAVMGAYRKRDWEKVIWPWDKERPEGIEVGIGGDHSDSYYFVREAHAKHGKFTLLTFDAHFDNVPHGELNYGNWINHSMHMFDDIVRVGVRAYGDSIFPSLDAWEAIDKGPLATALWIQNRIGSSKIYISIDIDVLDPSEAPGTGTPCPSGLSMTYLRQVLYHLRGLPVVGGDVMEIDPQLDPTPLTTTNAAALVLDLEYLING